jgi:hypothetical protein
MGADADLQLWAVVAASGTGKGVWIKRQLRRIKPRRLAIWDFKDEYGEVTGGATMSGCLADVRARMKEAGADGPAAIRYAPRGGGDKSIRREFEAFCELVYAWEHCLFVAEELAMVTTPGWAPAAWRKMCTSGRHARVHIIGVTQRPALVDKSFLGNTTLMHAGPMRERSDRLTIARAMDIDEGRLNALVKFQWLEKSFDSGQVTDGFTYPEGFRKAATPRGTSPTGKGASAAGRRRLV